MFQLLEYLSSTIPEVIKSDFILSGTKWLTNDFWSFVHSFIYGSIGGFAAVQMSQLKNEAALVRTKNQLIIDLNGEVEDNKIDEAFRKIQKQSKAFLRKTIYVYLLVGGLSGMLAVSTFNPKADELQTFSIAVLAGVSGFAFLKRNALIDDDHSDNFTAVEKEAFESYIRSLAEAEQITTEFTPDEDVNQTSEIELREETIPTRRIPEEQLEEFINDLVAGDSGVTQEDILYVRELAGEGETIEGIIRRLHDDRTE